MKESRRLRCRKGVTSRQWGVRTPASDESNRSAEEEEMGEGKVLGFWHGPAALGVVRRTAVLGLLALGLSALFATSAAAADKLSCLPVQRMQQQPGIQPANKKIGVSVAYLKVPFYANYKTG